MICPVMKREPGPARNTMTGARSVSGSPSCPPALANLNAIADRPDVLALSFGVTYWDYLGWKDSFASPRFTARQMDYAHHNGSNDVGTPQIWINGRSTILGSNRAELDASIAEAAALGPKAEIPSASNASTSPSASGASGPTTTNAYGY